MLTLESAVTRATDLDVSHTFNQTDIFLLRHYTVPYSASTAGLVLEQSTSLFLDRGLVFLTPARSSRLQCVMAATYLPRESLPSHTFLVSRPPKTQPFQAFLFLIVACIYVSHLTYEEEKVVILLGPFCGQITLNS